MSEYSYRARRERSIDGGSPSWPADARRRLIEAWERGGYRLAMAEFPNHREGQLRSAYRRFIDKRPMGPASPMDPAEARVRMAILPLEQVFDRLADLLDVDLRASASNVSSGPE